MNELTACYERELAERSDLSGEVVVELTIRGGGIVSKATLASSTLHDPAVEECLLERFQEVVFPGVERGGNVVVRYPLVFRAGRPR